MSRIKAVIFDLDGPIYDSFKEGCRRIFELFEQEGISVTNHVRNVFRDNWGAPGTEMIMKACGVSEARADELYEQWGEGGNNELMPLVPKAREVIEFLRNEKGIVNTILTSRTKKHMFYVLRGHRIDGLFDFLHAKHDSKFKKPHHRVFERTLAFLGARGIKKKECVFMGDTKIDLEAGFKAGIRTVAVLTGPLTRGALKRNWYNLPQENILDSIADFPKWLKRKEYA